jgi:hypothetical protein
MMYQITNAKEFDGDRRIRWYTDEYFDLVTWLGPDDSITAFQLVYNRYRQPYALTWNSERGYLHEKVDDGEWGGRMKMSPILLPDGIFHNDDVASEFFKRSRGLEPTVADFVYERLKTYKGK